jgi:hypothetical protein
VAGTTRTVPLADKLVQEFPLIAFRLSVTVYVPGTSSKFDGTVASASKVDAITRGIAIPFQVTEVAGAEQGGADVPNSAWPLIRSNVAGLLAGINPGVI